MAKLFRLSFPDKEVHKKLKTICVVEDITMNDKLIELIEKEIAENIIMKTIKKM